MRASIFMSVILATAAIGSAQADPASWNTTSSCFSSHTCTSTGSSAGNSMTFTAPTGESLSARAFYISGSSGGSLTGTLQNSALATYDQGLGVTTTAYPSNECSGCSPEHTLDNVGLKELIVFQLPGDNWDPQSVSLYPFGSSQDTDVTFYVGGTYAQFGGLAGFHGKTLTDLVDPTKDYKFKTYDDTTDTTGQRTVGVGAPTTTGRYLIVAAWLHDATPEDHFKIGTVAAKSGGGTSVPEPATLSLLTFGICAVGAYRRRRLSSEA